MRRSWFASTSSSEHPSATMPPAATSSARDDLLRRLEAVIGLLGYDRVNGLVRRFAGFRSCTNRHVVRQAFDTIRIHSVFGFKSSRHGVEKFSPVLYLAAAGDEAGANDVHRLVWSQGVVPILVVSTPNGLQIRRSLGPSTARPVVVAWDKLDSKHLRTEQHSCASRLAAQIRHHFPKDRVGPSRQIAQIVVCC